MYNRTDDSPTNVSTLIINYVIKKINETVKKTKKSEHFGEKINLNASEKFIIL